MVREEVEKSLEKKRGSHQKSSRTSCRDRSWKVIREETELGTREEAEDDLKRKPSKVLEGSKRVGKES